MLFSGRRFWSWKQPILWMDTPALTKKHCGLICQEGTYLQVQGEILELSILPSLCTKMYVAHFPPTLCLCCFRSGTSLAGRLPSSECLELGIYSACMLCSLERLPNTSVMLLTFLESTPQISCGFCLLHCQYATDPALLILWSSQNFYTM